MGYSFLKASTYELLRILVVKTKEPAIDAPRRLLQFAVRDALGTSRPSNSAKEPVVKRLRSVVSTATGDSSSDHPRRIQSVARVANPMATAIKAVAEAAEDVIKFKASGSVFDRLSRGAEISEFREAADRGDRDQEYGDFNKSHEQRQQIYHRMSEYSGEYVGNRTMLESETALTSDSFSDNEGYDDLSIIGHRRIDEPQSDTYPVNTDNDSRMVQYNVGNNAKNVMWVEQTKDELNLLQHQLFTVRTATNIEKESLKTLMPNPGAYTAGRPLEDADSRTIFVSNVHFAATKDSLSRHFNKFGEVLKVVIVTDAATGQPKGSAYVEFMRKEAADNALSLDGTSFMSRILKVVKRSSAQQETAPIMTWSRTARGSAYTGARFARVPFPRGVPGVFRPRLMVKPGARSMQWKRDAQVASAESGSSGAGNSGSIPTPRSLTYIRTEPKSEGVQVQHNLAI
ncbi:uncharacterized protein LOC110826343 [Carica papaya]|uniref:uncharacterized protein LOC110826343 n=1 Tax=Carica papaya TaxID=3649 RepID=UPI000B8CA2E9|nr:uncharacterized protein LOC110826343 [Carica papaya]